MNYLELADKHLFPFKQSGNEIIAEICPFCHNGSGKDKYKFSLNIEKGVYKCMRGSCGAQGHFVELCKHFGEQPDKDNCFSTKKRTLKPYKKPTSKYPLTSKAIDYLISRSISKETAMKCVSCDINGNLRFDYRNDTIGDVEFVKFSTMDEPKRKQWSEKNGKAILFLMDLCVADKPLVIAEGEIDAISLIESGIANAVSVPTGSQGIKNWVKNCENFLLKFSNIIVFEDNDIAGAGMAKSIAKELSNHHISIIPIEYYKGCKDPNEILCKYGKEVLREAVNNAIELVLPEPTVGNIKIKRLSEVEPEKIAYLVYPYIPLGKLTVMGGYQGGGKTWLSLKIAAAISIGENFLDPDNPFVEHEAGMVVYMSRENGMADVVRPRLDKMDVNLDNIITIIEEDDNGNYNPISLSDRRIEAVIEEYRPKLLILDPLQSYLGDDIDMHRANTVRPVFDMVSRIAEKYNCAVLIIAHLNKMTGMSAQDRILGTTDITAAARSVLIVGRDPDDPDRIVMAQSKASNTPIGVSIAFRIDDKNGVIMDGEVDLGADDIVGKQATGRNKPSVTLEEAKEFLAEIMNREGFAKSNDITKAAEEKGVSQTTLYRAKKELGLKGHAIGFGKNKISWWTLPDVEPPQEPQQQEIPI